MLTEPYADRCWEWPAAIHPKGYGWLTCKGRNLFAHRMLYEMAYGPIPDDLIVMHRCDNRLCINPAHLRLGTHVDNVADMDAKGRRANGSRHGRTHLTEADVISIRLRHADGESGNALARAYGVTPTTMSMIVNRKTWKHVA